MTPAVVPAAAGDQPATPVANGVYSTTLTLGQQPGINRVSIKGSATLPVKRINRSSGELYSTDATDTAFASFDIWGVLPRLVPDQWILVNSKGYPTADVPLQFSVLPEEYPVGSMAVRFYENGLWQYMGEVPVKKSGDVLSAGGAVFDPAKRYDARLSLFNAALESDPVKITVAAIDLDIDSDNKSGINADGTHKDPVHSAATEEIEAIPSLPGKFILLNAGDRNGDSIPDFADGYDLQTAQPADNGSAAFIPMLLTIPEPIDLAQARLRFHYNASDPAGVTRTAGPDGKIIFTPAPEGHIRLWRKDGIQGRLKASAAKGGDYLKPGEVLTVGQLGDPVPGKERTWRFYVEGVALGSQIGEELIRVDVDPDGNGTAPFMIADEVRATVNRAVLVPDYDHNGKIENTDKLLANLGEEFHFWVNNDDDKGETEGTDIPGSGSNGTDDHVNGVRDLVDFFPVYVDLMELSNIYDPAHYLYRLRCDAGNINIVEDTGLVASQSGNYLTGVGDSLEPALTIGNTGKTKHVTSQGIALSQEFVNKARTTGSQDLGVILVEGRSQGLCNLTLNIEEGSQTVYSSTPLKINLTGVEQMFRHVNLIKAADENLPDPKAGTIWGMPDRLETPLNAPYFESDKNFVFVHGYNVNGNQARGWQSEMFKRMYWSVSKARFWGVTWYGSKTQEFDLLGLNLVKLNLPFTRDYHTNVVNALKTAPTLADFLKKEVGGEITILGHSLGNMVVSSAISEHGARVKNYFMVDAAVASEAYGAMAVESKMNHPEWVPPESANKPAYDSRLFASEWYRLFLNDTPADNRARLTWRNKFANRGGATFYNFFSSGEEVLDLLDTDGYNPSIFNFGYGLFETTGRYAWVLEELLKGRLPFGIMIGSKYGGWGFNEDQYYKEIPDTSKDGQPDAKIRVKLAPEDTSFILNNINMLRTKPFFSKESDDAPLFTESSGNSYASTSKNMERLLAGVFPARTAPAGKIDIGFNAKKNYDMQAEFKTGWPKKDESWFHSDIREVAYSYIYKLFNKFTDEGALK